MAIRADLKLACVGRGLLGPSSSALWLLIVDPAFSLVIRWPTQESHVRVPTSYRFHGFINALLVIVDSICLGGYASEIVEASSIFILRNGRHFSMITMALRLPMGNTQL